MRYYTTAPVTGADLREGDTLRVHGRTIKLDHDPILMENGTDMLSVMVYVRNEDRTWPEASRWWIVGPTQPVQLIARTPNASQEAR